eukprot:6532508-Pyramimonas_sp.AAC.1
MARTLWGATDVVQFLWCILGGVINVVQPMWRSRCGATYVQRNAMPSMWCNRRGEIYVAQSTGCRICGVIRAG